MLDPSFGGCSFFRAGIETLARLGSPDPFSRLSGFDIDPDAETYLRALPGFTEDHTRFRIREDFLLFSQADKIEWRFDTVVGNPPYVRHHALSRDQVDVAQAALSQQGYQLPRTASYWSYFVLHSLSFLKQDGRLAMVLPMAFLSADYAKPVQEAIRDGFATSTIIILSERQFVHADERSLILLADGWQRAHRCSSFMEIDTPAALSQAFDRQNQKARGVLLNESWDIWREQLLSADTRDLLCNLRTRSDVYTLDELAAITIGIVTGANDFFLLKPSQAVRLGITARYLRYCLSNASQLRSLANSGHEIKAISAADERCLLLVVPEGRLPGAVKNYVQGDLGRTVQSHQKCRAREQWYRITDEAVPDAIVTPINGAFPKLVLNSAASLCTNSLYRVFWQREVSRREQKAVALAFASSLGGLSTELSGRVYGGGALKLEPSDLERVILPIPSGTTDRIDDVFHRAGRFASAGDWQSVRRLADEEVLQGGLRLKNSEVTLLRSSLAALQNLRLRRKAKVGDKSGRLSS